MDPPSDPALNEWHHLNGDHRRTLRRLFFSTRIRVVSQTAPSGRHFQRARSPSTGSLTALFDTHTHRSSNLDELS